MDDKSLILPKCQTFSEIFMARNSFSLYKRRVPGRSSFVYYAQFWGPVTSRYLSGRSVERLRAIPGMDPDDYSSTKKADALIIAETLINKHLRCNKYRSRTSYILKAMRKGVGR